MALRHGRDAEEMSRQALCEAVRLDLRGKRVLIKPNIGFKAGPGSGVVTNPRVVVGAVRWAKEGGAREVMVGDGCIYGVDSEEAFAFSGIQAALEEEGVQMVHLDRAEPVEVKVPRPMIVETVRVSSVVLEADVLVSVPVVKSHMHTGATLSLKNMKGVLFQREKVRMHHLSHPDETGQWKGWHTLDLAIADVASAVLPHAALLDATVVLEGMGPMIGDPRRLDTVIASDDPLAADLTGLELIGFDPADVSHLMLTAVKQGRSLSLEQLDVDLELLSRLRTPIRPAVPEDISSAYPCFVLTSRNACSACDSTAMAFLKRYGEEYKGDGKIQIAMGKGVLGGDIHCEHCILLGNCTAGLRDKGTFIQGCPPIASDVKKALDRLFG
ncbi:MAG: DUF362 domain-containing protein [Desulfobacteraceae bacterium]